MNFIINLKWKDLIQLHGIELKVWDRIKYPESNVIKSNENHGFDWNAWI